MARSTKQTFFIDNIILYNTNIHSFDVESLTSFPKINAV